MHPLVTIKFVDVRAATLFGPQEQGYYNTGKIEQDTGKRTASIYGGSFYKVLFSMPSPLFKLKLKGFYGKPITLDLAISSYKSNFNSASGCFEMTVTFVGYMYGIYVDLPLSYVVLAPYLSMAENQDWLTNPSFYFKDVTGGLSNQRIFTYSELRKLIAEANANIAKLPAGESTAELANIEKEEKAINELVNLYKGYLDDIFEKGFYVQNYKQAENPENKATYCLAGGFVKKLDLKSGSKKEGVTYWIQLKEGGEQTTVEKDVSKHTSELQEKIKQYNDAYNNALNGFNPNTYLQIGGFNKTDTKAYVLEETGYESLEDYFSAKYNSKYKTLLGDKFDIYCTIACRE